MKSRLLLLVAVLVLLSSSVFGAPLCQTVLVAGNFQELITAGSCNIGNVLFAGFNTNMNPTNLLVSTNGGAGSALGSLIGFTYNFVGGTLPAGNVGVTATFDPTVGVPCPGLNTCGLVGAATQIHVFSPNPASVTTVYSGGFVAGVLIDGTNLSTQSSQNNFLSPGSVTMLSTYNGAGNLSSFESDVVAGITGVPEPTSLLLFGTGLAGLAFIKRRSSRKS